LRNLREYDISIQAGRQLELMHRSPRELSGERNLKKSAAAARMVNIDEIRSAARRRLPRMFFDFVDGGSFSERTRAANMEDFSRWNFRSRALVDVSSRDLSTTVFGEKLGFPLILGPTGFAGLLARRGEVQAARAAAAAGIPFTLSMMSICGIEDVQRSIDRPFWFNLYMMKDANLNHAVMERAATAGCRVLVLTLDSNLIAIRERDIRSRFIRSPKLNMRQILDLTSRPRWALDVGLGPRLKLGNLASLPGMPVTIFQQAALIAGQADLTLSWEHVAHVRSRWAGKLVLKGIMTVEDARRAADAGADGIVVSNHGGRQLDGAPSSIRALPQIAAGVGDRMEVLFDGGVRRGQHIATALALGARACLVGRPWNYGLAAAGEAGVARVIELLRAELDTTLGLMGYNATNQLYGQANTCLDPAH